MSNNVDEKTKQESVTIKKKTLLAISSALPMLGILISKGEPGPLLLYFIGIGIGFIICWTIYN